MEAFTQTSGKENAPSFCIRWPKFVLRFSGGIFTWMLQTNRYIGTYLRPIHALGVVAHRSHRNQSRTLVHIVVYGYTSTGRWSPGRWGLSLRTPQNGRSLLRVYVAFSNVLVQFDCKENLSEAAGDTLKKNCTISRVSFGSWSDTLHFFTSHLVECCFKFGELRKHWGRTVFLNGAAL